MTTFNSFKLDRTAVTVVPRDDGSNDRAFWQAQSAQERLLAVESFRRLNYGDHQSSTRLQRVLEIIQLSSR